MTDPIQPPVPDDESLRVLRAVVDQPPSTELWSQLLQVLDQDPGSEQVVIEQRSTLIHLVSRLVSIVDKGELDRAADVLRTEGRLFVERYLREEEPVSTGLTEEQAAQVLSAGTFGEVSPQEILDWRREHGG
jgi:hypothetical protein